MFEMRNDCCWCGKDISEGQLIVLPLKFNEKGKFLEKEDGYIKEVSLVSGENLRVIITGKNSPAKKEEKDMLFMCCSEKCAQELKQALKNDKKLLNFVEEFKENN